MPYLKAIIAVSVTGLKLIYMKRSQWVAILTGAFTVLLGLGYLVLVQLLDWRGELLPAPTDLSITLEAGFAQAFSTISTYSS